MPSEHSTAHLNFLRITDATDASVPEFMQIFEASFPFAEKREREHWIGAFRDSLCDARVYRDATATTAIIVSWNFEHCRYIEYFALAPDARGNGLGSSILKTFIEEKSTPVVLEIEPPENEKNIRRLRFYERLGFSKNDVEHFHPPYHANFPRERLVILNHGTAPLSEEARKRFVSDLENRTMIHAPREE